METPLRGMFLATVTLWFLILVGVFALTWCDQTWAANVVVGLGPAATVLTVWTYVEGKSRRDV
jgi:hypothetical protein